MKFECVIFDMDGTLTEPWLDFPAIRAELGLADEADILVSLAAMDDASRTRAEQKLHVHEMAAARSAPLADGAREVLGRTRQAGLATALLTRNTREAMQMLMQRFDLTFDLALSREDGPIKPSPETILAACRRLDVSVERTACVGDWVFDIQAANAAGCLSVLLARGRRLDFADQADHVIETLGELADILEV